MTVGRLVAMVLAAVGAAVVGILTLGRRRGAIIPCLFPIFVDGVLASRAASSGRPGTPPAARPASQAASRMTSDAQRCGTWSTRASPSASRAGDEAPDAGRVRSLPHRESGGSPGGCSEAGGHNLGHRRPLHTEMVSCNLARYSYGLVVQPG